MSVCMYLEKGTFVAGETLPFLPGNHNVLCSPPSLPKTFGVFEGAKR